MGEEIVSIVAGLNRVAASQYGLLTRRAALDAGLKEYVVDRMVETKRWTVIHPGVYALGPLVEGREAVLRAALLWCGGGAVLSHTTAAELYELDGITRYQKVHLLRPMNVKRKQNEAMQCHRTGHLPDEDVTVHRGFAITTVTRTLLDLAAMKKVTVDQLERAVLDAIRRKYLTALRLAEYVDAVRARHPVRLHRLEEVLSRKSLALKLESELEAKMVQMLAGEGLLPPESQKVLRDARGEIGRFDLVYRRERVLVEVDGRRFHETTEQMERDAEKTRRAEAVGYAVLRARHQHLTAPAKGRFVSALRMKLRDHHERTGRDWPWSHLD